MDYYARLFLETKTGNENQTLEKLHHSMEGR